MRSALMTLRALLPFLAPYRTRVVLAGVALLLAGAAALAIPLAFRRLIDLGFGAMATGDAQTVDTSFAGLILVAAALALGTALRFYLVSWLGERVTADLREAVYRRVLLQDPGFFETLRTGEVLSRLTTDTTLIQTLVGTSVSMGLRNALLFAGSLVMMAVTSPGLASLIVALVLLLTLPLVIYGRRVRKLSRASQDRMADASAMAGERLSAIQTVQAFAREGFEARRFAEAVERGFATSVRRVRARAVLTALAILTVLGAIVFVLWLGAQAVLAGRTTAGTLTQFLLYAAMLAMATGALSEVMGDLQRAAGATDRLFELLAAEPRIARVETLPQPASAPTVRGGATLAVRAVTFAYPSRPGQQALTDVSFEVAAGERVAIVGPSGAGKSTLLQLLLRFHDPDKGTILLDGLNIRGLEPAQLRGRIGVVTQDNVVFSEDAMENIRYGRLEATDDEVIAAARAAHAHEFIERLPEGYRTFLGERGVRLSGGQRQRIAIARALLKNPPLLLLDEATSALDAQSERLVQQALESAMRDRTTLVIAHRLATVVRADRILVIDAGRLVEQGTHASLTAQGGLYARLARMQFATDSVPPA
jgi:ATP-binding cassette subfamily B protein